VFHLTNAELSSKLKLMRRAIGAIVRAVLVGAPGVGVVAACDHDSPQETTPPTVDAAIDVVPDTRVDSSTPPPEPKPGPYPDQSTFACDPPLVDVLSNLKPATPIDYVELRTVDWRKGGSKTVDSFGTPCATAADAGACSGALAIAFPTSEYDGWLATTDPLDFGFNAPQEFVVYTRGEEVGIVVNEAALGAFLAPIDTLEEARLMLRPSRLRFDCRTTPWPSGWRRNSDGSWELIVAGFSACFGIAFRDRKLVMPNGVVIGIDGNSDGECGRRPCGLVPRVATAPSALGAHFANAAHLEAASITAFDVLARDLARHGAPARLVARALRARRDEIAHARMMTRLATRFGATPPRVEVEPTAPRDLLAVALENEIEGCVRETYGALVAAFQARTAAPALRPILRRIADDEASHAALAHDVGRWARRRLDARGRAALAHARRETTRALRREARTPAASLVAIAGLPDRDRGLALIDGLATAFA
jgi:hypothetical protein